MEMSHRRSHTEAKHSAGKIKWTGKRSCLGLSTELTTKCTKRSVSRCNVPVHSPIKHSYISRNAEQFQQKTDMLMFFIPSS